MKGVTSSRDWDQSLFSFAHERGGSFFAARGRSVRAVRTLPSPPVVILMVAIRVRLVERLQYLIIDQRKIAEEHGQG